MVLIQGVVYFTQSVEGVNYETKWYGSFFTRSQAPKIE